MTTELAAAAPRRLAIGEADDDERLLERVRQRTEPLLFVIDDELRIVVHSLDAPRRDATLMSLLAPHNGVLAPILERAVRELLNVWRGEPSSSAPLVALALPFLVVRVHPLEGRGGRHFAVLVEPSRSRDSLTRAAETFKISRRELEVLALLLQGLSTPAIAEKLFVAPSTADFHMKRLLAKTGARNRPELAAKVLGWSDDYTST